MNNVKSFKETWKNVENIAVGGQGSTMKASRLSNDNQIAAVKTLNRQNDIERRARMQREATSLSTLNHPNLAKIIDSNTEYWEDMGYKLFIATEYIPGNTIETFDFSAYSIHEKIGLIVQISEVVDYCHSGGIVHRDIKPDNIILRNNSITDPVIIDFGISFNSEDVDDDNLTADGQQLGNRFLILPEQKVGEDGKRDQRSDVTCLVGMLYYILVGSPPAMLTDVNEQKPHQRPSAKTLLNQLPAHTRTALNNLFDIGFNQQIDKRWQTTTSLIAELKLIANSEQPNLVTSEDLMDHIKSISNLSQYRDIKDIKLLQRETIKKCDYFKVKITKELGEDWIGSFKIYGDSQRHAGKGYGGEKVIANKYNGIVIRTFIKVFVTGNELVVHSLVEGKDNVELSNREVLRKPVQLDDNWGSLESNLRQQYLEAIAEELRNNVD